MAKIKHFVVNPDKLVIISISPLFSRRKRQKAHFNDGYMLDLGGFRCPFRKKHSPFSSFTAHLFVRLGSVGDFAVSQSASNAVREYIRDQKEHHKKRTFENEYVGLLSRQKIDFDDQYLWE